MVRNRLDQVQWGVDRLRIGAWHGDASVGYVVPVAGRPLAPESIDAALDAVAARGYAVVLTAALTDAEQQPFLSQGFAVRERLCLLRHDLTRPLPPTPSPGARIRRARWTDRDQVLEVDHLAFDDFWRFDRQGLAEARAATPSSRFRVADDGGVVGYAITGRAGATGYLQRLAVHPRHRHRGTGTRLVADALGWAVARGATSVLVNTQEHNEAALRLYRTVGFRPEPSGLAVLERRVERRIRVAPT